MRKSNLVYLALVLGLLAEGHAAAAVISAGSLDAGAQMERDRRAIERERVMEHISSSLYCGFCCFSKAIFNSFISLMYVSF